jgi:mono/diheme cytochrome c family protein
MSRARSFLAASMILATSLTAIPALSQTSRTASRGEYLARIMDCAGCHTPGALIGKPDHARNLAGSEIGFHIPGLGFFYPPNLTPDAQTGLGAWSEADIMRAVRTGVRPDGRMLAPAMPWHSYAALTDADAHELARYLKSMSPVRNAVPPLAGPDGAPSSPYLTVIDPKG